MKTTAPKSWNPRRFDVRAFAEAGASLAAEEALAVFERLTSERHADGDPAPTLHWSVQGQMRPDATGRSAVWLLVQTSLTLPVVCQRCLGPVAIPLQVDRWFRFVADEAAALAEDDACEEDVLALEPKPDLLALIEDELLMEIPLVPMHGVCPVPLAVPAAPAEAEATGDVAAKPFASLARLKQ